MRWFDFYRHDMDDVILAINGYYEERVDDERMFRRLGLMTVSPYIDGKFNIYKYWPIAGDDEIGKGIKEAQHERMIAKLRELKVKEQIKKQNGNNN